MPLSESDLLAFCGNALHLAGAGRRGVWALSACARRALGDRAELLERTGRLVAPSVDTIERVGGGGVRCMLAELFARSRSRI
ncbi:MAG: arginine deiminase-related protein [Planctomycetota bacterium]